VGKQVFLLEALDRPRLLLPLLPPLALLIARGWTRLGHRVGAGVLTAAAFGLFLQTLPLAAQLTSVPAPPAQATAYIAAHYPSQETVVAVAGSFRAAQVELPDYRLLYLYRFDAEAARATVAEGNVRYVAVLDRDQFSDEVMAVLSREGQCVPLDDRTFERDPRVHTQHDRVRLQVLTPANQIPSEALAPPEGGCIDIGGTEDGRYLDQGWYRPEEIGGIEGRWAGEVPGATVRLYLEPERDYRLTVRAMAYPSEQEVSVWVDGKEVGHFALPRDWTERAVVIPASRVPSGEVIVVKLVHRRLASPFLETQGASSDRRLLAAAYDWVCVTPVYQEPIRKVWQLGR